MQQGNGYTGEASEAATKGGTDTPKPADKPGHAPGPPQTTGRPWWAIWRRQSNHDLLLQIIATQETIMADLSGLEAELEDLKTSSQTAFDAVLAAQASAAASMAALQAQIDELTAGAVTQEQIDALTATAQEADEDIDAIAAAVTPPAEEPAPEEPAPEA